MAVDYPHASIKKSLELAEAAHDLGGNCSVEMCADKLGKKVGGAFNATMSAAKKYGLVDVRHGQVTTTELFREYRLAYDDEERRQKLQYSFLGVPLFQTIYDRFHSGKLPVEIFEKFLVRELGVSEQNASRVAKYFIDGAKAAGLLSGDNTFAEVDPEYDFEEEPSQEEALLPEDDEGHEEHPSVERSTRISTLSTADNTYVVSIKGPGMDTHINILEEEDLMIVNAMLAKVKRKLAAGVAGKEET